MSIDNQNFLQENIKKYSDVYYQITDLERAKILTSSMPIKLQTFAEKAMLIKNFPECLDAYNEWCSKNQKEGKLDKQGILEDALEELKFWYGKK